MENLMVFEIIDLSELNQTPIGNVAYDGCGTKRGNCTTGCGCGTSDGWCGVE